MVPMEASCSTATICDDPAWVAQLIRATPHDGNPAFDAAIEDEFSGSLIEIDAADGLFGLSLRQDGLHRALETSELSNGTLRYIAQATARHTPRPPELMVLNEPEGSLHPSLLEPLARMIAVASGRSQIIVVCHAKALVEGLTEPSGHRLALDKENGETIFADLGPKPNQAVEGV